MFSGSLRRQDIGLNTLMVTCHIRIDLDMGTGQVMANRQCKKDGKKFLERISLTDQKDT